MHAVVVRETVDADRIEESKAPLEAVVPRVRQSAGIVSALWTITDDGRTLNALAYDSEDAALGAMERIRNAPRPDFVRLESVELADVLATF
jgi:muconolactone delta-isomerase